MASNIKITSGSNKAGNPIVLSVTPGTAPTGAIFHKINVVINVCASSASFGSGLDFKFSTPVSSNDEIEMDISSALSSFLDSFEYSPTVLSIPTAKFKATVYDEYMVDGLVQTSSYVSETFNGPYSLGAYSDVERIKSNGFLNATEETAKGYNYSNKPSSPEIVYAGDTFVYPSSANESTKVDVINTQDNPDRYKGMTTIGGHSIYVVTSSITNHFQIRFVNRLGTIESISVLDYKKVEMAVNSQQYFRTAKSSSFSKPNGSYYKKQGDRETWYLSTGPIDEDWKLWYSHELLMTPQAWVYISDTWLPIHIISDDTTELIDNTNQKPYTLQFKASFDIEGPLL